MEAELERKHRPAGHQWMVRQPGVAGPRQLTLGVAGVHAGRPGLLGALRHRQRGRLRRRGVVGKPCCPRCGWTSVREHRCRPGRRVLGHVLRRERVQLRRRSVDGKSCSGPRSRRSVHFDGCGRPGLPDREPAGQRVQLRRGTMGGQPDGSRPGCPAGDRHRCGRHRQGLLPRHVAGKRASLR